MTTTDIRWQQRFRNFLNAFSYFQRFNEYVNSVDVMYGLKQNQIDAINNCFAKYPEIDQVILYGSRAKGNYKPGSDIDLVIIDHNLSFSELVKLENEIDDLLLPYIIDLSLKRKIDNADLIDHIDRIGKVFYDKVHQSVLNEPPAKKADEI